MSEYAFTMLAKKATVVEIGTLYALDSQAVRYGSDNFLAAKAITTELYMPNLRR